MTTLIEDPAPTSHPAPVPSGGRRRTRWWAEALLAVAGYELYGLVQTATDGARGAAVQHGWAVIHLEQRLHVWIEPSFNRLLSSHPAIGIGSDYYYELTHAFVTAGVLIWLWRRHPATYARWRNILIALSLAALLVFWAFPVAPPRLTDLALTDTLTRYDALGATGAQAHGLVDQYAALPSLHVAWALWCALAVACTAPRVTIRVAAFAYPFATAVVVLATANHYVMDVLAGSVLTVAITAVAIAAARQLRAGQPATAPARLADLPPSAVRDQRGVGPGTRG
jgi:hypothetical protein